MRIALVLSDDVPAAAARRAEAIARGLRRAGHVVETFTLERTVLAPFPGHPGAPKDPRPLSEAVRANARFDAVAAFGWEAYHGMFALDAAAYVHVVGEDPRRRGRTAASEADAVERACRAPGAALVATTEALCAGMARESDGDVLFMPSFVDVAEFSPAAVPRDGRPLRVLVEGPWGSEALDVAARVAARGKGLETWHVPSPGDVYPEGPACRVVEPAPLEARPSLLRACDAVLVPDPGGGDDLPVLEAMGCGLVAVAARAPGRAHLLRHEDSALVVEAGDVGAMAAALDRVVGDPGLRARLRAGALRTAAGRDVAAGESVAVDAFLRGVAAARRPSPEERREAAAIAERLRARPRAVPAGLEATPPRPPRPGHERGVSLVRRAARRVFRPTRSAARPSAVQPLASPAETTLGAGEPVVFAGQPAYFRSAYADAVLAGWGVEYAVRLLEKGFMDRLPRLVETTRARTCVVFDPWLLAAHRETVAALRAQGVRLVAYSTEPVPPTDGRHVHWDALRRLDSLRRARDAGFDLWIHHDPTSEGFLRAEGFAPLVVHPLPVSEHLFHPEEVERDVDACFLGWSTPHREAFLSPIEGRFRTVHVAHGFFDEEARRLMNRSKVVLNLHAHEYANFENRCVQALFCGRPLVSEWLSGGYLAPGDDYLLARTPDEMLACVRAVVGGDGRTRAAPAFDRSRFLVSSLRALLASTRRAAEGP